MMTIDSEVVKALVDPLRRKWRDITGNDSPWRYWTQVDDDGLPEIVVEVKGAEKLTVEQVKAIRKDVLELLFSAEETKAAFPFVDFRGSDEYARQVAIDEAI